MFGSDSGGDACRFLMEMPCVADAERSTTSSGRSAAQSCMSDLDTVAAKQAHLHHGALQGRLQAWASADLRAAAQLDTIGFYWDLT
jgi:hypothetical protein